MVANRITEMILTGEFPIGAKLPSQRTLSSQFGVSRGSIREAINQLEATGTLRTQPGRGTYIGEAFKRQAINDETLASQQLGVQLPQQHDYAPLDVCQFRHMLEGRAARLAAMRVTDNDIAALESNLQTFRSQTRALDLHEASVSDFEFHNLIIGFSGSRLFKDLHNSYRAMLVGVIEMPRTLYNRAWEPVVEHERIFEALKRRDPEEARYYMQSHIVRSAERLGLLLAEDVV